ncbi:hypothetical protein, partial [Methanocalculus sp.]|uniref:hypothetical protein n=1 Tax=Methanocalculus sp. TaxID=2004547 RepID=UPI00262A3B70
MTIAKQIPSGWKSVTLGDVVILRKESVQPSGEGTDRFVGLENITPGTVKLDAWAFDTDLRSTKSKFYSGDLLYGKLRPYLDKAVKADFDGICSTDILVLTPT